MTITLANAEAILEEGLAFVTKVAPLASLAGPEGAAIGAIVGQIASLADNLLAEVSSDAAIIQTGDLSKITALQQSLQSANATLAAQIAAS